MNGAAPIKFVAEPSSSLKCPLCEGLFRDPVISTKCGHTFCRQCVTSQVRNGSSSITLICPIDQTSFNITEVVPNKAVVAQLEDLLIYCRHGLIRYDSDEDFMIDDTGCPDRIQLGRRHEHENQCPYALLPCPNSSNHCGKFRRRDIENHLRICPRVPCPYSGKECQFFGTTQEVKHHIPSCAQAGSSVDWEVVTHLEEEDKGNGLCAQYLAKAVKNLNDRVTNLEIGQDNMLTQIQQCNGHIATLTAQMEKLTQAVEQLRFTQLAIMRERMGSQSTSDLATVAESVHQKSFSISNISRERASSTGNSHYTAWPSVKCESWKMPFTFKCIGTFRGHGDTIWALAVRGQQLFSGGADHLIKVWDVRGDIKNSRGCVQTLSGHKDDVGRLPSTTYEESFLGNSATPIDFVEASDVRLHISLVHALCTGGNYLYSAGSDKSIRVWNLEGFALRTVLEDAHDDIVCALCYTGRYLFSASNSTIKVWQAGSMELVHSIRGLHHWVRALAIDERRSRFVLSGRGDRSHFVREKVYSGSHNTIHIWEATNNFALRGKLDHNHGSVYSVAVTKQYLLIENCQEEAVRLASMRSFYSQQCSSWVKCHHKLCFSPRPKAMSNVLAAVPFVIVLSFLGLILKPTSDVLDWIAL